MTASGRAYCTSCGLAGHDQRPSIDPRYPQVRHRTRWVPGVLDQDAAVAAAAAAAIRRAERKAAGTAREIADNVARYNAASD